MSGTSRGWLGTNNAVPQIEDADWEEDNSINETDLIPLGLSYLMWQYELGEANNRVHQQIYAHFNQPIRRSALTKVAPWIHWEPRKGTPDSAINYCSKIDTRLAGPFEWGNRPRQGARNDLKEATDLLLRTRDLQAVALAHPTTYAKFFRGLSALLNITSSQRELTDAPKVYIFWGPPELGKTRYCYAVHPNLYRVPDGLQWFDGYNSEDVALIEEPDLNRVPLGWLLQLLDRYPMRVPTKGGFVQWKPNVIWLTTNQPPLTWYEKETPWRRMALVRRLTTIFSATKLPPLHESLCPAVIRAVDSSVSDVLTALENMIE